MYRKSQTSGSPAAIVVLSIAAFIIIFILLLPEDERNEILDRDPTTSTGSEITAETGGVILLEENPGTINRIRTRDIERDLSNFVIIAEKEDVEIKKTNSIFVESGGEEVSKVIPFSTEDGAENGILVFEVVESKGRLIIDFNGEQIFRGLVSQSNQIEPILISEIKEQNNLTLSVETPPSWKFWEKNYYDIRKINIRGTVNNDANSESFQTFIMSEEEADSNNIESAFLEYGITCSKSYGKIDVFVNSYLISSRVPDCGEYTYNREKDQIDPEVLREGNNELVFKTIEGHYVIDRPKIKTALKKPVYPLYFFNLNESTYEEISGDELGAELRVEFVDDGQTKKAILSVNGHETFINTRNETHVKNIDQFVKEGNNYIRVTPESNALHIVKMVVRAI